MGKSGFTTIIGMNVRVGSLLSLLYRDECKSGFTTIIGMNVRVGSLLL